MNLLLLLQLQQLESLLREKFQVLTALSLPFENPKPQPRRSSNTLKLPQVRNHLLLTPTVSTDITPRMGLVPSAIQITQCSANSMDYNGSPMPSDRRNMDKSSPMPQHRRPSTPMPGDMQRFRRKLSISSTPALTAVSTTAPSSILLQSINLNINNLALSPTIPQSNPELETDFQPLLPPHAVKGGEQNADGHKPYMQSPVLPVILPSPAFKPKQADFLQPSILRARRHMRSSSLPQIELRHCRLLPTESEPVEPHTASMLMDQRDREVQTKRRSSILKLQLRPFEPMDAQKFKKGVHRHTTSECFLQAASTAQFQGFEQSAHSIPKPRSACTVSLQHLLNANTLNIPLGSIFDDYCMSAEKLKYVQIFHLCSDLVDNFIISYRTRVIFELESKQLIASDARIENQLNRDLPYLLGDGECVNSKSVWVELAAKKMWKCLDFNGEGTVSKTKFIARFQKACQQIINIQQLKKPNVIGDRCMSEIANGSCLVF